MAKEKKNKDKKDKKKNKDRDRQKQRRDKKKKQKKRSYSSSSSSDSSDSSSSSQQRNKRKESKTKKKDKKQQKVEVKSTNNPYDFDKTTSKVVPAFPVGLPAPGFNVPTIHATPPPPVTTSTFNVIKPKTKQIHIFKLLPKLPFGAVTLAKTLYSTELIQQKSYNLLIKQTMQQIDKRVKQQGHKKAINIMNKCSIQIQKIVDYEEEKKKSQMAGQSGQGQGIMLKQQIKSQQNNRFINLKRVYEQSFQE